MILYFDNYITDEPLLKGLYQRLDDVRNSCSAYRMPRKIDIALYTLASYAVLNWSAVIIKYELQDKSQAERFESEVRRLFPKEKLTLISGRSDTQEKFRESLKMIREMGDEWIFFAGNVDHPFVAPETKTLEACVKQAKKLKETHRFVSVGYSHFGESRSMANPKSYRYSRSAKLLGEDGNCISLLFPEGKSPVFFDSIQIVHRNMMEHWFESKDLAGKRVIRAESVSGLVGVPEHVLVIPKREACAHFDGYSHIKFHVPTDPNDVLPPLFIPHGFFEGKIRIAFGYDEYREGWVNINPTKRQYSFRSTADGTDLKLIPEDLPLFWKGRIEKLDINPDADMEAMKAAYGCDLELRANPWPCSGKLDRTRIRLVLYGRALSYYKDNPEALAAVKEYGYSFNVLRKKALYAAIMAGYKIGVFRKKRQPAAK